MDDQRFDRLARTLAGGISRRRALAGLTGIALGTLGLGGSFAVAAPKRRRRRQDYTGRFCGGIAGIACPSGYVCVDDPADGCDPATGGADCGGTCRKFDIPQCGLILCAANSQCCPTCDGVGACAPIGERCPALFCGEPCGNIYCEAGEFCCNASCGICSQPGDVCTQEFCGEPCGTTVCGPGEYCCNASCSICAPLGGGCPELFCGEPCGDVVCGIEEYCCPDCYGGGVCLPFDSPCARPACPPPDGEPCGNVICGAGEYCCNASCSRCAPRGALCTQEFCGESCGDLLCGPGESCCPDCSGGGYCAPAGDPCPMMACPDIRGEVCGPTICPPGEVCCNESCGICTSPGGACIMIACL